MRDRVGEASGPGSSLLGIQKDDETGTAQALSPPPLSILSHSRAMPKSKNGSATASDARTNANDEQVSWRPHNGIIQPIGPPRPQPSESVAEDPWNTALLDWETRKTRCQVVVKFETAPLPHVQVPPPRSTSHPALTPNHHQGLIRIKL